MTQPSVSAKRSDKMQPVVTPLEEKDLDEAARIFRHAFGTYLGVRNLENFWTDRDYVHGRHGAPHVASFGARLDGALVGSNFATRWGSFGFFGPLTVRPDLDGRGIGRALLVPTIEQFDAWGTRHVGLFTFAESAKHVGLYQKFGFYPRFLTAVMSGRVNRATKASGSQRYSALTPPQQEVALRDCRDVVETLYPGLDLSDEIRTVQARRLGDTILLGGDSGAVAFAVCHFGPRSEAGANTCLVKFAAVRDGTDAARDFSRLLDACEALAAEAGMSNLLAGANTAREEAYRRILARGYRIITQGIAMHRPNEPGYCRPGAYIIDDWR